MDTSTLTVQKLLNSLGSNLSEDGAIGPATIAEIKRFQAANNILPDGRVSSELITALKSKLEPQNSVSVFENAKSFIFENKKPLIILGSLGVFGYGVWFIKTKILKK